MVVRRDGWEGWVRREGWRTGESVMVCVGGVKWRRRRR